MHTTNMQTTNAMDKQKGVDESKDFQRMDYEKPVLGKIDLTAEQILGFCTMVLGSCTGSPVSTS